MGWVNAILGVLAALGLALLVYILWAAVQATRAGSWPVTPGTITRAAVKESWSPGGGDGGDNTTYEVQVEYTYAVDGAEYRGTRIAFGYTGSNTRAEAQALRDRLAAAESVGVRYNPADPASSTLSHGVHRQLVAGLLFLALWLSFLTLFGLTWHVLSRPDDVLVRNLTVR